MNFLNSAALFGLFAIAIPLALHFLNLKKLKRVEFSSLAFLTELKKSKIRQIKLKQLILLALRILIIVFLVLAFAKPIVQNENFVVVGENSPKSIYFLFDNSTSMMWENGGNSKLLLAKQKFSRIVKSDIREIDEIYFFNSTENVADFSQNRIFHSELIGKISNLNGNGMSGKIERQFQNIVKCINKSQNYLNEVYIISDFQRTNFEKEKIENLLGNIKKPTNIFVFYDNRILGQNAAITEFECKSQIFSVGKKVEFLAKIHKNTDKNSQIFATIYSNEERIRQMQIDFNKSQSAEANAIIELKNVGFSTSEFAIEDDNLNYDNHQYSVLNVNNSSKILVLSDDYQAANFVKLALENASNTIEIANSRQISVSEVAKFNLIFLLSDFPENSQFLTELTKLKKKIVIFPSSNSDGKSFENTLQNFGFAKNIKLQEAKNPIFWKKSAEKSEILNSIFEKEIDFSNSPEIYKFYKIGKNPLVATLHLENDSPFLLSGKFGESEIFVFLSALNLNWNDFVYKPTFPPILHNILQSNKNAENKITCGEQFVIDLSNLNVERVKVVYPNQSEEIIPTNNQKKMIFTKTEQAGIYSIFTNDKVVTKFAANFDELESKMEFFSEKEIKEMLKTSNEKTEIRLFNLFDSQKLVLNSDSKATEFWKIFLLLALIFAIFEMFMARNTKRDYLEFKGN